jgi:RNA polymerase sigma factor (sigma-70 family)
LSSLDKIDDASRIGAWLSTVARRQTWRFVERQRREAPTDEPTAGIAATDESIAAHHIDNMEWVHQGLERLDPRCRQLLLALYFTSDQRPYSEVSAELGIPTGSIGPTRARCLEKLRTHLDDLNQS